MNNNKKKSKLAGFFKGFILVIVGLIAGSLIADATVGEGKISYGKHKENVDKYDADVKALQDKEEELKELKGSASELESYLKQ